MIYSSVVPFGSNNIYSMCIDLTFWGLPEKTAEVLGLLKAGGFYPTVKSEAGSSDSHYGQGFSFQSAPPRRTFLSPADVSSVCIYIAFVPSFDSIDKE